MQIYMPFTYTRVQIFMPLFVRFSILPFILLIPYSRFFFSSVRNKKWPCITIFYSHLYIRGVILNFENGVD